MVRHTIAIVPLVAAALIGSAPATVEAGQKPHVIMGKSLSMGAGKATSWVSVDAAGKPVAMGISFSEAAFTKLPDTLPWTEYSMALPPEAAPFTHAVVNWNPKGHDPHGVYSVPHFDFHFYTIPEAVRVNITATGDDKVRTYKKPAPEYVAPGYIDTGFGEPRMGDHWVDPSSHEFHGRPFDSTFIYGYYDGKLAFYEVMASNDYMLSHPRVEVKFPTPPAHEVKGYYPTVYRLGYDAGKRMYHVVLTGFRLQG